MDEGAYGLGCAKGWVTAGDHMLRRHRGPDATGRHHRHTYVLGVAPEATPELWLDTPRHRRPAPGVNRRTDLYALTHHRMMGLVKIGFTTSDIDDLGA
jgi:hypothetical protein